MSNDQIVGLTLDGNLAETEYLKRELGINVSTVSGASLEHKVRAAAKAGRKSVVVVSNWRALQPSLDTLPRDSVVIVLLSDENYQCEPSMFNSDCVSHVYRNYSIRLLSFAQSIEHLGRVLEDFAEFRSLVAASDFLGFLHAIFTGLLTRKRIQKWGSLRKPVSEFPLGYTNKFARNYLQHLNLPEFEGSLFQAPHPARGQSDWDLFFHGSRASWQRQFALRIIGACFPQSRFDSISRFWMGHDDGSPVDRDWYVTEMCRGRIVPCPPGGRANESFRETEAAICGSIPLVFKASITQMTRRADENLDELGLAFSSLSDAVKWLHNQQSLCLPELASKQRSFVNSRLEATRRHLSILTHSGSPDGRLRTGTEL